MSTTFDRIYASEIQEMNATGHAGGMGGEIGKDVVVHRFGIAQISAGGGHARDA